MGRNERRVHQRERGRFLIVGAARWRRFVVSRAGALLACWALLLQSLIPLVHVPPPGSIGSADLPAWISASFCHVDLGPSGDDPGQHSSKHAPPGDAPLCPICLGLHLAGTFLQPGAATDFRLSADHGVARFVDFAIRVVVRPGCGPIRARAPPPVAA
jgi:hypothetical protein